MPSSDTHKRLPSPDGTGFLSSAQRFLQRSYAGDYIGLALIVVIYAPFKIARAEPFHQMFRLNDSRIQHPHAEVERVSVGMLLIYTVPIPVLLILALTLALPANRHKLHPALLGLAISMLLTSLLTDIFKNAIGRPRPDLIDRCQPIAGTPTDELVTFEVCTATSHHTLHDGFRSFPSGHSSLAWSSLGWLALFLMSQLHVLRPRANLASFIICLTPFVGAAMIAISRLEDYRHDVEDVIAGSVLGMVIAYLNWRRHWPSLRAKDCDEPYSLSEMKSGSPGGGFRRVQDEENAGEESARERFSIGDDER